MVYIKKQIIAGIVAIAYVALCAAVWPRNAEIGDLPAEPLKTAVSAEIEARSEETPHIFISEDMSTPVAEAVAESEPHNGDVRVVDGEKQIYLLGFGWIKDEGSKVEPIVKTIF